jgi:hypothetical protein
VTIPGCTQIVKIKFYTLDSRCAPSIKVSESTGRRAWWVSALSGNDNLENINREGAVMGLYIDTNALGADPGWVANYIQLRKKLNRVALRVMIGPAP